MQAARKPFNIFGSWGNVKFQEKCCGFTKFNSLKDGRKVKKDVHLHRECTRYLDLLFSTTFYTRQRGHCYWLSAPLTYQKN